MIFFKLDHYGIEMTIRVAVAVAKKHFKLDHYGIEIAVSLLYTFSF